MTYAIEKSDETLHKERGEIISFEHRWEGDYYLFNRDLSGFPIDGRVVEFRYMTMATARCERDG